MQCYIYCLQDQDVSVALYGKRKREKKSTGADFESGKNKQAKLWLDLQADGPRLSLSWGKEKNGVRISHFQK